MDTETFRPWPTVISDELTFNVNWSPPDDETAVVDVSSGSVLGRPVPARVTIPSVPTIIKTIVVKDVPVTPIAFLRRASSRQFKAGDPEFVPWFETRYGSQSTDDLWQLGSYNSTDQNTNCISS